MTEQERQEYWIWKEDGTPDFEKTARKVMARLQAKWRMEK